MGRIDRSRACTNKRRVASTKGKESKLAAVGNNCKHAIAGNDLSPGSTDRKGERKRRVRVLA
jgi:hypothetical protein